MAETFPNRIYQHAAQTDRLTNTFDISTLPTIWDRLAAAGPDGRYYFSDVPFLALWGTKYLSISRPFAAFLADCAAGHAARRSSFVDPRFLDEESGTSDDDHPHADIRNGEAFLNLIYTAVTTQPRVGAHRPRHQLRRVGRLLRSRAAADRADPRGRRGGRQHRWAARFRVPPRCSSRRARSAASCRTCSSITRRCCA